MRGHDRFSCVPALALLGLFLWANSASAYIGQGAGLEVNGRFTWLLVAIAAAFGALLLWPIYRLICWAVSRSQSSPADAAREDQPQSASVQGQSPGRFC